MKDKKRNFDLSCINNNLLNNLKLYPKIILIYVNYFPECTFDSA